MTPPIAAAPPGIVRRGMIDPLPVTPITPLNPLSPLAPLKLPLIPLNPFMPPKLPLIPLIPLTPLKLPLIPLILPRLPLTPLIPLIPLIPLVPIVPPPPVTPLIPFKPALPCTLDWCHSAVAVGRADVRQEPAAEHGGHLGLHDTGQRKDGTDTQTERKEGQATLNRSEHHGPLTRVFGLASSTRRNGNPEGQSGMARLQSWLPT